MAPVFNIYQFGSRVYEPDDSQNAHWSFIIVMGDDYKGPANFTRGTLSPAVCMHIGARRLLGQR
jgi:hypothetical protein